MSQQEPTQARKLPQSRPLIYLITDRRAFRHPQDPQATGIEGQLLAIEAAVSAGCHMIQIRERDLEDTQLSRMVSAAIEIAHPRNALIFVNDRIDVVLETGADGVHLRASSPRPIDIRRLAAERGRSDLLIGASTHSLDEARSAPGADFLVCGPIYETPSKREFGEPLGLTEFSRIAHLIPIPVLGLGGICRTTVSEVLEAGAAGIAGIGLFAGSDSARESVRAILAAAHENR